MTKKLTPDDFDDLVLAQYKAIIAKAGKDGLKRGAAAEQIVKQIRDDVAAKKITLPVDVETMVDRVIHDRDETARRSQVDHIQLVVDCINGATILGSDDPIMDEVALAGSGLRKTWRHVSVDDLNAMAGVKLQHATDATTAANEFHKRVTLIVRHLLATFGADGLVGDISVSTSTDDDGGE